MVEAPMISLPPTPENPSFWFVGATWNSNEDQTQRFLQKGIWENGHGPDGDFSEKVARMRPGERIAIKSAYVRKHQLPFDAAGKLVSVMRIKAVGTLLANDGDGRVSVAWEAEYQPKEWFFFTIRNVVWECDPGDEKASRLISFAFENAPQDYAWWLNQPYWANQYKKPMNVVLSSSNSETDPSAFTDDEIISIVPTYTVADIVHEGCFVAQTELNSILERLKIKLNVVLQGPPGTGKTWLAKRLAAALIGQPSQAIGSRVRVVQFHPSYAYEDFVRGYRPKSGEGLALVDGVLLEAVEAAKQEGDKPFVLVIEEINRGNPAQVFGEMLTLLEHDKRVPSEAVELAYRKSDGERIYLPPNLYVIGTMNVADRSLALVDLALRRRFAFISLKPCFDTAWQDWCKSEGKLSPDFIEQVGARMKALNVGIAASFGEHFAVGHSYVTPAKGKPVPDGPAWFRAVVKTELAPLLDEYWYEAPEKAQAAAAALVDGW